MQLNTQTADDLLKCADLAMFNAKDEGRNRYAFFNQTLSDKAHLRVRLERDLRVALQQDAAEIQLHYQPIYETQQLKLCGFEALLRWQHPTLGMVAPDRFIQVAEQSNQIFELGELVSRRLVADFPILSQGVASEFYIALNLSAKQFEDSLFMQKLQQYFSPLNLWPFLQFEVTETAFLHAHKLEPALVLIQQQGASVALDDFGTGYSSLSRLKDLPLDCLKIDRSFVAAMGGDEKSLEIVKAVCTLGKALDLQLVAEGVETLTQLKLLQQIGCDKVQGYLLAKPMPAREVVAFLTKSL